MVKFKNCYTNFNQEKAFFRYFEDRYRKSKMVTRANFQYLLNYFKTSRVCHETLREMTKIRKCSCKRLAKARYDYYSESKEVRGDNYIADLRSNYLTKKFRLKLFLSRLVVSKWLMCWSCTLYRSTATATTGHSLLGKWTFDNPLFIIGKKRWTRELLKKRKF